MGNVHITIRTGDTIRCHKCGKQWDVNDPEPPECVIVQDARLPGRATRRKAYLDVVKRMFGVEGVKK